MGSAFVIATVGLVTVWSLSGCGSPDSDGDEVRRAAHAFARAVDPGANPGKLCELLAADARRTRGCRTEGEDIGPLLQLSIDSERDVRVIEVKGHRAVVHIPSIPFRGKPKGAGPPQVLRLQEIDGEWKFTRLELCEPPPHGACAYPGRSERRLLVLRRQPYMGVACARPNLIDCDRVGLAVWLEKPARHLTASIAGRKVKMRSPGESVTGKGTGWEGYLQPAALKDDPFNIRPDAGPGRWVGRKPVYAAVRITAHYGDGRSATKTLRVMLAAGWG